MDLPRFRTNFQSGFTLVEMIVVLFVISVVLMIALPDLRQAGVKAQVTTCEANQRLIRTQMENYYLDHQYRYPFQDESRTAAQILQHLQAERYLQSVPVCPSGGEYDIQYPNGELSVRCTVHGVLGLEGAQEGAGNVGNEG